MSHPMWVCGLKQHKDAYNARFEKSHPMWVCGLKQINGKGEVINEVAPYVGVWIETLLIRIELPFASSRTLCGCVD